MIPGFEPMTASECVLTMIRFPVYVSPKLDGYRAVIQDHKLFSRRLISFPNIHVNQVIEAMNLPDLDGEITVGPPNAQDVLRVTGSALRTRIGKPQFTYHVFDYIDKIQKFEQRLDRLKREVSNKYPNVEIVPQVIVQNLKQLDICKKACLDDGYEGVMIRGINSPYKFGRSTVPEGWLLKLKDFVTEEATVIGFQEQLHNDNVATRNALGRQTRSSHKANKTPAGTLGSLICKSAKYKDTFKVKGFDADTAQLIWNNQNDYLNRVVTYKRQATGLKDRPRHADFVQFRDKFDIGR
jgi:DNA ligase-1